MAVIEVTNFDEMPLECGGLTYTSSIWQLAVPDHANALTGTETAHYPGIHKPMFDKLLSKPLSIEIKGQSLSFNSVAEFEFAMSGRTEVPTSKMSDLVESSRSDLKREAKSIKAVERQFVDILSRSIETSGGIGKYLRKIDPHVFSQDHSWRDIMISLREKDEDYDELRKIAIVKYMQYLTARQELIKHTYSVKKMQDKLKAGEAEPEELEKEAEQNASPSPARNSHPRLSRTTTSQNVTAPNRNSCACPRVKRSFCRSITNPP